jgi:hypothetical protein
MMMVLTLTSPNANVCCGAVQSQKPGARPLPCFFGPKDFEALVESDCVFTRKMHPEVSGDLYAMLDQHISTQ